MKISIGCVVEGHGDVKAVPVLLRKLAFHIDPSVSLEVPRPIRTPRYKLVKQGELERAVRLASRNAGPDGAILVLIDAEDDCPAEVAPLLLERARQILHGKMIAIVLAKYEFESWFLASASSLGGFRGLEKILYPPAHSEVIRDAKKWLNERNASGRKYKETLDQPALAEKIDIDSARSAPSFDKLFREMKKIIEEDHH